MKTRKLKKKVEFSHTKFTNAHMYIYKAVYYKR